MEIISTAKNLYNHRHRNIIFLPLKNIKKRDQHQEKGLF